MTAARPRSTTADLVCIPDAIPAHERPAHFELGRRLFTQVAQERLDRSAGIAWRLPAESLPDVARFVANERRCCPFLAIEIEIEPADGPMWLRLTGPEGTRELLDAELGLAGAGSCRCSSAEEAPP